MNTYKTTIRFKGKTFEYFDAGLNWWDAQAKALKSYTRTHPAYDAIKTIIALEGAPKMTETPSISHFSENFSEKVVFKDEYGDSVSFQVDEGIDSDHDNKFYLIAHDSLTNGSIDFLFTREQLEALIQFLANHTVPDEVDEKLVERLERAEDSLRSLNSRITALAKRLAYLEDVSPKQI